MEAKETTLKGAAKAYLNTQLDIVKLEVIQKAAPLASVVILGIAGMFVTILSLTFFGLAAAYVISDALNSGWAGFLIVGVFYVLVFTLLVIFRVKLITLPVVNSMLKHMYYKEEKQEEKKEQDPVAAKAS